MKFPITGQTFYRKYEGAISGSYMVTETDYLLMTITLLHQGDGDVPQDIEFEPFTITFEQLKKLFFQDDPYSSDPEYIEHEDDYKIKINPEARVFLLNNAEGMTPEEFWKALKGLDK